MIPRVPPEKDPMNTPLNNPELQNLQNPNNWTQEKTWVVPLKITIMVDDASKYDAQMKQMVGRIVNEIRSVSRHFDKSGKQLIIEIGDVVTDVSKWGVVSNSEESKKSLEDTVAIAVAKALAAQKANENTENNG